MVLLVVEQKLLKANWLFVNFDNSKVSKGFLVIFQTEIYLPRSSQFELWPWRLRVQFVFYQAYKFIFQAYQFVFRSSPALKRAAAPVSARKREKSVPPNPVSLNYSNEHSRVNITDMAQRGTPRKLEARISWVGLGRVERPRCIKLLFRATTNTQTGIGCLQNLCFQLLFKTNSPPCLRKTDTKHRSRPVVWLEDQCSPRNPPV